MVLLTDAGLLRLSVGLGSFLGGERPVMARHCTDSRLDLCDVVGEKHILRGRQLAKLLVRMQILADHLS